MSTMYTLTVTLAAPAETVTVSKRSSNIFDDVRLMCSTGFLQAPGEWIPPSRIAKIVWK